MNNRTLFLKGITIAATLRVIAVCAFVLAAFACASAGSAGSAAGGGASPPALRFASVDEALLQAAAGSYPTAELVPALLDYGKNLYTEGKLDDAVKVFDAVLMMDKNLAEAYSYRGNAHYFRGDYDRAIADYDEALRINPNFVDAHNNRNSAAALAKERQEQQATVKEAELAARQKAKIEANSPQIPPDDAFEVRQNSDNTITITRYNGAARNIIIPDTLYGLKVTVIGAAAFRNHLLNSVVIPDTVTTIGAAAFAGDYAGNYLRSVTIGKAVKIIGEEAFSASMLTEIVIPDSVTVIGHRAFSGKPDSSESPGSRRATDSDGRLFFISGGLLTKVQLGRGLKTIGGHAFAYNMITEAVIPNGVTLIVEGAFFGNPLTELVIPPSLAPRTREVGIGSGAFKSYSSLTPRITLPANMDVDNMQSFESGLVNFYISQNRAAGTYVKNGPIWTRQ